MNKIRNAIVGTGFLLLATCSLAAGSLSVERETTVNASPDTAWKLVGNFNGWDVWHPAIVASTMKGTGTKAGATRSLTLGNGAKINEKLTAYSSTKRSYSYVIIDSPLPVKNYLSTLSLSPADEGKTLVKWTVSFDANGTSDDEARKLIGGIYDAGLERISSTLKK